MDYDLLFTELSEAIKELDGKDIHDAYPELAKKYDILNEALNTLTEREKNVLKLHCGLTDGKKYTYEEIGKMHMAKPERVEQIFLSGIRKLNHPSRIHKCLSHLRTNYKNNKD